MSRGVDIDVIALRLPGGGDNFDVDQLEDAIDQHVADEGYRRLEKIDDILLNEFMEWLLPSERCVGVTETRDGWKFLYDTNFSQIALTDAVARAFPNLLLLQVNLQERTDLTLRVLKGGQSVYEFSNGPEFVNWGRCLGKSEAARLARPEAPSLANALGIPGQTAALDECFKPIVSKFIGEPAGAMGRRKGGVGDAVQKIAQIAGMPPLYRFFEGWMKSELDWDEDEIEIVYPFRKKDA